MIYLRAFFNKLLLEGFIQFNPLKGTKGIKPPEKLPLFLTRKEFNELLKNVENQEMKNIFIIAVHTGLRLNELKTLTSNQIDYNNRLIYLSNRESRTKTDKVRSIPLNKEAMKAIKGFQGIVYSKDKISKTFKSAVRQTELNPKIHFHSLRHTFASWLVQKGVSIYEVAKLLGHSSSKTTEIYAHLAPGNLRKAVELIEDKNQGK